MKDFALMITEKILYGVCTVGDYLLFGGGKLLRYRSPEPEVVITDVRSPEFASNSEFDVEEMVREQHEEWVDLVCPSRSYLPQNAFFNDEFFASTSNSE